MDRINSINEYDVNLKPYLNRKLNYNKSIIMIAFFIIIGLLIGISLYFIYKENIFLDILNAVDKRINGNFFDFINISIIDNIKLILLLVIFSTTPLGQYIIPLIMVYKGMYIGFISLHLYVSLGIFTGLLYNCVVFLPNFILSSFFLVFISKNAINISKFIYFKLFKDTKQEFKAGVFEYYEKIFKLSILFLAFSIIEIIICYNIKTII